VALAVAVVKSTLVALFFMHLRWDKPFNAIVFISALLFVFLFITFALLDTKEYRPAMIPGYAPGITGVNPAAASTGGYDPLAGLVGVDRGRAIFETTCAVCHGPDAQGIEGLGSPALHRQEDWYLVGQLQNFRSGMRGGDERDVRGLQMAPIAKALPDEQAVHDVAEYISSLEGPLPTPTVEGDPVKGAETFKKICAACHGGNAMGQSFLKTPALVGQNDWYIVTQIKNFQQGIRGSDPRDITGQQMKGMASTLNDPVVQRDVVAYINSLSVPTP